MKRAEETSAASALSGGWETHASITWNVELLGPFCAFDPEQTDGEAGDDIQHLGSSITPSRDLILKNQKLMSPLENVDKSLSEASVQFSVGYNCTSQLNQTQQG